MIETPRLRLRPVMPLDLPSIVAALNQWSVSQWLARPPFPYTQEDAETFMAWSQPPEPGAPPRARAVADRASDALLGVAGLDPQAGWAELGYWLAPAARGKGLMREAVAALLEADAPRLPPVYATTEPDNVRSQALLVALGFERVAMEGRATPSRRGHLHRFRFERAPSRGGRPGLSCKEPLDPGPVP